MQFLRTLIWVLVAGIGVAFSFNNWQPVPVKLWGGLVADINLPLLLAVVFALGFVPVYLMYLGVRWRLKSRLASAERTLADLRAAQLATPAAENPVETLPAAVAPPLIPGEAPVETRA